MKEPFMQGPFDASASEAPLLNGNKEENAHSEIFRFLFFIKRYFWLPILLTILGIGAGYAITKKMTAYYKAQASVIVRSQPPTYLGSKMNNIITDVFDSYLMEGRFLKTQTSILTSKHLLEQTIPNLSTYSLKKLLEWAHINKKVGQPLTTEERETITHLLRNTLSVEQMPGTRILIVKSISTDPKVAADISNAVIKTYMEQNLNERIKSTIRAYNWLSDQLKTIREKFDLTEKKLYEYKKQHKIYALSLDSRKKLLGEVISQRQKYVEELSSKERELRAQLMSFRRLRSGSIFTDAASDFVGNTRIAELRDQYRKAVADLNVLKTKFLEKHPKVMEQETKVEYLKKALEQELSIQIKVLQTDYEKTAKLLQEAKDALRQSEKEAFNLSKIEIQYMKLKRERDETAKLYETILARLKELDLVKQLKTNNVSILDAAEPPPAPFKPVLLFNLAIGGALGIFLGLLILMVLYYMDTTITTEDELRMYLPAPFLGVVPALDKEEPLVLINHPRSVASEALRAIRTNLLFMSPDRPLHSFVISSANPQEGKTTLTANIGVALAMGGEKVLLVDTDMRRPTLHRYFLDQKIRKGLSTVIIGKATLDDVILETGVDGLSILPCGPLPPNPAELLQSSHFIEITKELTEKFDKVIFDSPPSLLLTDAPLIAKNTDGVLLVTRHGKTTKPMLRDLYKTYNGLNIRIIGVIMNEVNPNQWGSSRYYSKYGKSYYYHKYYAYGSEDQDSENSADEKED